jgi:multiple sugar transport system substrate-binding protein
MGRRRLAGADRQYKTLTAYNADASDFCNQSMIYKGMQYGLTYYTDYMGFIYDNELMQKAGLALPPTTWAEVVVSI